MIEQVESSRYPEWDEWVSAHPGATCYQLSCWAEVARAYRLTAILLASRAYHGGGLRGVLPLFVVPRPFRRYLTTGIFGAYGPLLADGEAARDELVRAACLLTSSLGGRYLHVKGLDDIEAPPGLERRDVWQTAMLDLSGGPERVWAGFKSSIRAAVRQARRAGLELREGLEHLPAFYEVLAANMLRKGSPIYGMEFMRALARGFGDRARVLTLWLDDRPISGALLIAHAGVAYVPFASSLAEHFRLRPNNLLYWHVIERACADGLHALDFGTSLIGSSSFDFKLHWGAVPRAVPSYVWAPRGRTPRLDPGGTGVRAGMQLWTRLPRRFADSLGPWVCRYMV